MNRSRIDNRKNINEVHCEKISVIIPAYNEEKNIVNTLKETVEVFKNLDYDFELIVVNDGSKDKTYNIAKKYVEETKDVKNKIKIKPKGEHKRISLGDVFKIFYLVY